MEFRELGLNEKTLNLLRTMGAPSDFIDHLQKHIDYAGNDPSKFPVSEEIKDERCLMFLAELDRSKEKLERSKKEFDILMKEDEALRGRFFLRAEEIYPHVKVSGEEGNTGFRSFEGKWYLVAFPDCKDEHSKE